jgi:hypothetical protein
LEVDKPVLRVRYEFEEIETGSLGIEVFKALEQDH